MNFVPYTVARYGIYTACAVALLSIFIGRQAGASFDFLLLRSIAVFVIVTALGLGAEAVLSFEGPKALPAGPSPAAESDPPPSTDTTPESSTE
jgi:hypothetical protein